MLGLKRGTVSLCPHQKDWESAALDTISRLFAIFGSAAVDIIHAGSTAIVHIQAKPILDITVGVRDLADVEPLPWVGDAGNGNAFDGQQSDDAAADVHERAERLHAGDPTGDNRARLQMTEQGFHGFFLGFPAAEPRQRSAFGIGSDGLNCEAYLLANP